MGRSWCWGARHAHGLLLFGSVNLRVRVLWRWQALPLITGLVSCAGFVFVDGTRRPATFLCCGRCLGWAWSPWGMAYGATRVRRWRS
jgi:hypothetical protein